MSSTECLCPPLGTLLAAVDLRALAASFEAVAIDDALPATVERRRECWRMAAALRLAAHVVESGEACVGGHLAALELEIRGK